MIVTHPPEQELEEGREAVFMCGVEGKPEPTVFWSVEGNHSLVFPGEHLGRLKASLNAAGNAVLSIQVRILHKKAVISTLIN